MQDWPHGTRTDLRAEHAQEKDLTGKTNIFYKNKENMFYLTDQKCTFKISKYTFI